MLFPVMQYTLRTLEVLKACSAFLEKPIIADCFEFGDDEMNELLSLQTNVDTLLADIQKEINE